MNLLITGTSSGIGRTLAEHFSGRGWNVWGLARRSQDDFAAQCRQRAVSFRAATCDVASWPSVQATAAEVETAWPHLDALVCCAAVQAPMGPTMALEPEQWARNVAVNLNGTFHCLRAFHPLLLRATPSRRAKVVCFSGGGATSPRPNFSAYAVTKTAVVRLVENLAREWNDLPIDINAIAPGAVNTHMTEELLALGPRVVGEKEFHDAAERKAGGATPPEKYIGLTEFLLSPQSNGISGRLLSAPWDPWPDLPTHTDALRDSDIYTLRRITPKDRHQSW